MENCLEQELIAPSVGNYYVAKDRMEAKEEGVTCHNWFFRTKALARDQMYHPKS